RQRAQCHEVVVEGRLHVARLVVVGDVGVEPPVIGRPHVAAEIRVSHGSIHAPGSGCVNWLARTPAGAQPAGGWAARNASTTGGSVARWSRSPDTMAASTRPPTSGNRIFRSPSPCRRDAPDPSATHEHRPLASNRSA